MKFSYLLHPLDWDEGTWKRLLRLGGSAGMAACQLHGLGTQDIPEVRSFSGLLLRGQRDGAVVRRQVFWSAPQVIPDTRGDFVVSAFGSSPTGLESAYPLEIFVDDPAGWLQNNP